MINIDNNFIRLFSSDEQLIMLRLLLGADDDGRVPLSAQSLHNDTSLSLQRVRIVCEKLSKDGIIISDGDMVKIRDFKLYKPKQRKRKENQIEKPPKKHIEERRHDFGMSLAPYIIDNGGKYPKEMIRAFYNYWSEPNQTNTRMRCEMQQTWSTAGRLATWASKDRNFNRYEQRNNEVQQRQERAAAIIARLGDEEGCDTPTTW